MGWVCVRLRTRGGRAEPQRIALAAQRVLYDRATDEGRTREHFLRVQLPAIMTDAARAGEPVGAPGGLGWRAQPR